MDFNDTNYFMLIFLHEVLNAEIKKDKEEGEDV